MNIEDNRKERRIKIAALSPGEVFMYGDAPCIRVLPHSPHSHGVKFVSLINGLAFTDDYDETLVEPVCARLVIEAI